MSDREYLHDDAGAYLLGALDEPEREAFEAHLADCPACREELERLRPAAEALPRSVEPLAPPPRLRRALMDAVREEAEPVRVRRRMWPRLALPRRSFAWAGAAATLLLGAVGGFGAAQLAGDDTRTIPARAVSPQAAAASGSLSVPDGGEEGAILRVTGMPAQPGGVYQAWVQRDGQLLPQPTFEVGEDGVGAVAVTDGLKGAEAVLVTREPRGGSRAPTGRPMLSVTL